MNGYELLAQFEKEIKEYFTVPNSGYLKNFETIEATAFHLQT